MGKHFKTVTAVRGMEWLVRKLGGFQHTYCDSFQTKEEFMEMLLICTPSYIVGLFWLLPIALNNLVLLFCSKLFVDVINMISDCLLISKIELK